MFVTSIAGSSFTVEVASTEYTAQVKRGGINSNPNIVTESTLGPNKAITQTDVTDEVACDFLYDGAAGFYKALWDASRVGTGLVVTITGGAGEWTGTLKVSTLSNEFDAESSSACSATFTGVLDFDGAA